MPLVGTANSCILDLDEGKDRFPELRVARGGNGQNRWGWKGYQVLKAPQRRVVNQPCFAQITFVSWKPIPYVRNNFCSTAFGKLPLYFLSGNGSFVLEGWKQ